MGVQNKIARMAECPRDPALKVEGRSFGESEETVPFSLLTTLMHSQNDS